MPGNRFGEALTVTTWGESHGPALGCVVDGVPPRIPLSEADVQHHLDRRKPGQSRHTTQRREADRVRILSGVFDGYTTGTPLSLMIENADQRGKDYTAIKDTFRPGHADYTYWAKYGIRDYRGGGRASARETAMRVAAGAIARTVLGHLLGSEPPIRGAVVQLGPNPIDRGAWDWDQVEANPFFCPDAGAVPVWESFLDDVRRRGSSAGAVIEIVGDGIPPGLGEPVYDKVDADLAKALMSINAVKGVEIGNGFAAAATPGEDNADSMRMDGDTPVFRGNNNGGTLGGITSGQPVVARFAVKPTSSIRIPRESVDIHGREVDVATHGRHDPCVGIRAVPVGEAMMALVLADHLLRHRGQTGE